MASTRAAAITAGPAALVKGCTPGNTGYGDIKPTTDAGRAIAMVVMVVGIGFVALLTAAAAERFMRPRTEALDRGENPLEEVIRRLDSIKRRLG